VVGAEEEFHNFATKSGSALARTAYLLTGDRADAEDLVQSALARTWGAWSRLEDVANAEAYTRTVLTRLAQRGWRRRARARVVVPEMATSDLGADVVRAEAVRVALQSLPRDQRAVLVLRYFEQRSEAEIAVLLGCSPGTVKSRASRALARLRSSGLLDDEPVPADEPVRAEEPEVRDVR
jgi:RNA polymerase sigma-70 factor (sigma-E family)